MINKTEGRMSVPGLRSRLLERIGHLESRMEKTPKEDPAGTRLFQNIKTELNTAKRRLRLLNEKFPEVSQ